MKLPRDGYYEIWTRAIDSRGLMQPHVAPNWNPSGYGGNPMHRVAVLIGCERLQRPEEFPKRRADFPSGAFKSKRHAVSRLMCRVMSVLFAAMFLGCGNVLSPSHNRRTSLRVRKAPRNFLPASGRDETFYTCTACHNFKLVAQQGMSRRQWDETTTWMTRNTTCRAGRRRNVNLVLNYLETTYPPRVQERGGWQNPFLNR